MMATPAVACGTKTLHRPSPRSPQNERTASVRSTIRRRDVSISSTSESMTSSLRTAYLHREGPIESPVYQEEAGEWSAAPPGRCPNKRGVDRVRTLYHNPGATFVDR